VTHLARGMAASTLAGVSIGPQSHTAFAGLPMEPSEVALAECPKLPQETTQSTGGGCVTVRLSRVPEEWGGKMEREFRALALEEAKGTLTAAQRARLEELSVWRDRLVEPRLAEEVLLQLKRDRLLEKISEALKEYVEFQAGTDNARPAAC